MNGLEPTWPVIALTALLIIKALVELVTKMYAGHSKSNGMSGSYQKQLARVEQQLEFVVVQLEDIRKEVQKLIRDSAVQDNQIRRLKEDVDALQGRQKER